MSTDTIITEARPPAATENLDSGFTFGRVFQIVAGSELEARAILFDQRGVRLRSVYQSPRGEIPDASVICTSISYEGNPHAQAGGKGLYTARATFGRATTGGAVVEPEIGGPAVFHVEETQQQLQTDIDRNGNPILNSAGEPFKQLSTKLKSDQTLVADWYLKSSETWLQVWRKFNIYTDHVNSGEWFGEPRGSYFCLSIRPTEAGKALYRMQGRFRLKPQYTIDGNEFDGWSEVRTDKGLRQINAAGDLVSILGDDGQRVSVEQLLDGAGKTLAAGQARKLLEFKHYPEIDFKDIGIGG